MDIDELEADEDTVVTAPSSPLVNSSRSSCLRRRSTGDRSTAMVADADAMAISHNFGVVAAAAIFFFQ